MYNFASTQEFFDEAVRRLHQMAIDGPCVDSNGHCMYRNNDPAAKTKACIAGSFIADEHYTPAIECLSVSAFFKGGKVIDLVRLSGISAEICSNDLMRALQGVHDELNNTYDCDQTTQVNTQLERIASSFDLTLAPQYQH